MRISIHINFHPLKRRGRNVIIANFALLNLGQIFCLRDLSTRRYRAGHRVGCWRVGSGNGSNYPAALTDPCLGLEMLTWHYRVQLHASLALRMTIHCPIQAKEPYQFILDGWICGQCLNQEGCSEYSVSPEKSTKTSFVLLKLSAQNKSKASERRVTSAACQRSALRSDWQTCIQCEKFLYPILPDSTTLSHHRQWWNGRSKTVCKRPNPRGK